MEFLASLKEAISQGFSKDEYMAIWNREMELKLNNNDNVKDTVMPLLMQITEQQNKVQLQQSRIQQQLNELQVSHDQEQQKMQQQFEKIQESLSEKIFELETALAKLHESLTVCVRQSLQSESLDVQEKLSLITETICNHMLDEMRNVSIGTAGGLSKTLFKVDKGIKKQVHTECDVLEESSAEVTATLYGQNHHDTASGNGDVVVDCSIGCDGEGTEKVPLPMSEQNSDSVKRALSISDSEFSNAFKSILRSELNSFLVSVQKLLLKPINSEDISYYITDRMKEVLQYERNVTTEQLLNVQTAISADIQARLYKIEMCFRHELEKVGSSHEHNEQLQREVNKMLTEIHKLKGFLTSELPNRVISHMKRSSVSEMKSTVDFQEREMHELEDNMVVNHDHTKTPSQLGEEMIGEGNNRPKVNDDFHTNFCLQNVGSDQGLTLMLMLLMNMLMLLTYHDTLDNNKTPATSSACATSEPKSELSNYVTSNPSQSKTTSAKKTNIELEFGPQHKAVSKNLTDAHLKLMFGEHKEAQYMCRVNYSNFAVREDIILKLMKIDPGYNLQLKATILEKNSNLNFHIMSISGDKDESLAWPANFNINITLMDKQPQTCSKQDHGQSFIKTKSLYKPTKSTGHSTPTPLCYFRDDLINKSIHDDTLVFKVSVRYVEN